MIQPCHMILLIQGIALYSKSANGVLITIFVLPALTGTMSAMLFPDTSGLDQPFEMHSYWIQHYIIQAVPLYLLARRNFLALKFANWFSVFMGVWILLLLHFSLYEVRPTHTVTCTATCTVFDMLYLSLLLFMSLLYCTFC